MCAFAHGRMHGMVWLRTLTEWMAPKGENFSYRNRRSAVSGKFLMYLYCTGHQRSREIRGLQK